jgi:hypothetical protein
MPVLSNSAIPAGSLGLQPVMSEKALSLRPWTGRDVDALVTAYAAPEIQRWTAAL